MQGTGKMSPPPPVLWNTSSGLIPQLKATSGLSLPGEDFLQRFNKCNACDTTII